MRLFLSTCVLALTVGFYAAQADADTAGGGLNVPAANRVEGTLTCAATATRIPCPSSTKFIHTSNPSATSVWFGGSAVTTANSPVERSSTEGKEYTTNGSALWCISAAGVASVRYSCAR